VSESMSLNSDPLQDLRTIVGDEPSDEDLRALLRGHSVEAAANRFFDVGAGRAPSQSAAAERGTPSPPPGSKRQKIAVRVPTASSALSSGLSVASIPTAVPTKPLAERMRPTRLADLFGQSDALDAVLRSAVDADQLPSLILWGPPGCGKTSFASCVAATTKRVFRSLSAAKSGVADLREELTRAANALRLRGSSTILFVDELHRWSKAQQDALLMDVEKGTVVLIGATTENPSFTINNAILSRCRLVVFQKVDTASLSRALDRALASDVLLRGCELSDSARHALIAAADGDVRVALNTLELAAKSNPSPTPTRTRTPTRTPTQTNPNPNPSPNPNPNPNLTITQTLTPNPNLTLNLTRIQTLTLTLTLKP
jgi:hypothetical protein